MRKGVVVCGANGERGYLLEKVTEAFAKDNMSKVIQFSVCTVGLSPIMLEMGGVDMSSLVTVNGCRNRCCDRMMEKNGLGIGSSITIDDHVARGLSPCQFTTSFDFPEPSEEEVKAVVKAMEEAIR
ncbi:MAG TPA: hypothetical protein VMW85_03280 [Methanomassiliicoccales archaeon]|nr:hypothetical protein [Methanomassiliicoccales archaeon]